MIAVIRERWSQSEEEGRKAGEAGAAKRVEKAVKEAQELAAKEAAAAKATVGCGPQGLLCPKHYRYIAC